MKKRIFQIVLWCIAGLIVMDGTAQTSSSSYVFDYRDTDGKIIVTLDVNGRAADFVVDLAGHTALLPAHLDALGIDTTRHGDPGYDHFLYKQVATRGIVEIGALTLGDAIYKSNVPAFVLDGDPAYLQSLDVAGIIGGSFFRDMVLTIDSRHRKITLSLPYRPTYMKLNYRADMRLLPGSGIACDVTIGGENRSLLLDTWADALVNLTAADYETWNLTTGTTAAGNCQPAYSAPVTTNEAAPLPDWTFVKTPLTGGIAVKDTVLSHSTLGLDLLRNGLLSIDFPRQKIYYQPFDLVAVTYEATAAKADTVAEADGTVTPLHTEFFVRHIFDSRLGGEPQLKCRTPVHSLQKAAARDREVCPGIPRPGIVLQGQCRPRKRTLPILQRAGASHVDIYSRRWQTHRRGGRHPREIPADYRGEIAGTIGARPVGNFSFRRKELSLWHRTP